MFGVLSTAAVKGASYVHYFYIWNTGTTASGIAIDGKTGQTLKVKISKDGGAFSDSTNNIFEIGLGLYSITLTATEMDADTIAVYRAGGFGASAVGTIIQTVPQELTALPGLTSSIYVKITAIFQYLFYRRKFNSTAEVLYKSDGTTTIASSVVSANGDGLDNGAKT